MLGLLGQKKGWSEQAKHSSKECLDAIPIGVQGWRASEQGSRAENRLKP
jgi:hypothetical protein